jgi:predicted Zn-ribbon and HTH transcriptional regulator
MKEVVETLEESVKKSRARNSSKLVFRPHRCVDDGSQTFVAVVSCSIHW